MLIAMQYHPYPPLRVRATEIDLKAVEFISSLIRWIGDTYESLMAVGNIK